MTCIALIWKSTSSKGTATVRDDSAGVVQVWWWCRGRLTQRIALVLALTDSLMVAGLACSVIGFGSATLLGKPITTAYVPT